MIHPLTKELIDRVYKMTQSEHIHWNDGPGQNAFAFDAEGFSVVVDLTPGGPTIMVADNEGRELETLTSDDLAEVRAAGGQDYETIVREIHGHARRTALGTDAAIRQILTSLDGAEAE